jgi:hypothetical protein
MTAPTIQKQSIAPCFLAPEDALCSTNCFESISQIKIRIARQHGAASAQQSTSLIRDTNIGERPRKTRQAFVDKKKKKIFRN